MLADDHEELDLSRVLDRIPCGVELPADWTDYFDRRGPGPIDPNNERRFHRHFLRGIALLESRSSLPAIARDKGYASVYTKDICREGLGFLHVEQLYPGEKLDLRLKTGRRSIEVVRCLRHNSSCYEIGALFRTDA